MSGSHIDEGSELGTHDMFAGQAAVGSERSTPRAEVRGARPGAGVRNIEREAPAVGGHGWARGPIPVDRRKFRYDVTRAKESAPLSFSVTKADRMDATEAGEMLHSIHVKLGIDTAEEARILAFDKALWFEHTINGASMMQPGRGVLVVDGMSFDIAMIKGFFGESQRRFFRAYADVIAEVNREVLMSYDPYDSESVEKVGQLRQVASERGLHKYPHLAHDSSDACVGLSQEERMAVLASKRVVIASVANKVDGFPGRVPDGGGKIASATGVGEA